VASRKKKQQSRTEPAQGAAPTAKQPRGNAPWVVALVLVTLFTFGGLFRAEFTSWDDYGTVARNAHIASPTADSLAWLWTHPHMDLYVPVTYTLWWALSALAGGPNAALFHGTNVALHAAAAVVLFLLIRRLGAKALPAFLGAALFALHPVQVESVGWVSGLKDVLCGLLSLVSVWQYVKYATSDAVSETNPRSPRSVIPREPQATEGSRDGNSASPLPEVPRSASLPRDDDLRQSGGSPNARTRDAWSDKRKHYAIAAAAFLLALLAKPTAVVVPAVAFVLDVLVLRRPVRRSVLALGPWLLPAAACLLWTKAVQPAHYAAASVPVQYRPLIAADALAFYLYKLAWPAQLAVDYGRTPERVLANGWLYYTWVAPAAVALLLLWRRRDRWLLAGAALFVLGLAPVLGLVRFDFQLISTTADHYLYLPMAGVALALAAVADRLSRRTPAGQGFTVAAVVVLLALAVRSAVQTTHWHDTVALFQHNLDVNPNSWVSHNSLAAAYVEQGNTAHAIDHARRAADLRQDDARVWGTLASALAMNNQLAEARDAYRKALELEPNNARLHAALAGLLAQQNQLDPAMAHARRAIELDPSDAQARLNYGTMLAQSGKVDEGIEQLREATRLAPGQLPQAHANLGLLYLSRGTRDEAIAEFRSALAIDPNFAPAREGLRRASR
jgi:tetratricopeptide (TPR) repeat protein